MSTAGKTDNKLKTMESFKLIGLMSDANDGYAVMKKSDAEYADFVNSRDLGFKVTAGNISGAREALGLPATKFATDIAARTAAVEVLDRLNSIENMLTRIIKYMSEVARRDI